MSHVRILGKKKSHVRWNGLPSVTLWCNEISTLEKNRETIYNKRWGEMEY